VRKFTDDVLLVLVVVLVCDRKVKVESEDENDGESDASNRFSAQALRAFDSSHAVG
jgi:hypothetical protein